MPQQGGTRVVLAGRDAGRHVGCSGDRGTRRGTGVPRRGAMRGRAAAGCGMLSSREGGEGRGGAGGGSTWLISRRQFNIYEVLLFESQVFGSSYKELRHPPITW